MPYTIYEKAGSDAAVAAALAALPPAGTGAVDSVNGLTGAVTLDAGDVGADPAGTAAALVAALPPGGDSLPADAPGVLTNDGAGVLTWEAAPAGAYLVPDPTHPGLYLPTAGSAMVEDPAHDGLYTIGTLA